MNSARSLPLVEVWPKRRSSLQLHQPVEERPRRLPRLEWRSRSGNALHASPLGEPGEVLAVNLTAGCAHQCAYCSARAYSAYPGDEVVYLYARTPEMVHEELARLRKKPRAVFLSPSTDPFPPSLAVQRETAGVIEVLASHGVESWLMTRGLIRPSAWRTLEAHREFVKVTVGLTTLERRLQRTLEPLAAPPRLRLRQIARLRKLGIPVQAALEPLIPEVTDTRSNLMELLEALAHVGVRQVTAGYLFLRPGIQHNLVQALQPHVWSEAVPAAFADGPFLKGAHLAAARYLPKHRRQRGYAALMALAANLGMAIRVCALTNPDFQGSRASAGEPLARQRLLSFLS